MYNAEVYYQELRHKLQTAFKYVRENLNASKNISNANYDKHINPAKFLVNQRVLIRNTNRTGKLVKPWKGLYIVTKVHNAVNVSIRVGTKIKRVHVNRLKAYHKREKLKNSSTTNKNLKIQTIKWPLTAT